MIEFKEGVRLHGLAPQMVLALRVAEAAYESAGVRLVITSANDSLHKKDSLHYQGRAVDLRIKNVPAYWQEGLIKSIKDALGIEFDVIWEAVATPNEHLHIEWDPPREPSSLPPV